MRQVIVKNLGRVAYLPTWEAMQNFTAQRGVDTPDEIWLVEHAPVYTVGLNGKPEHLLQPTDIPVIKIDRGGQITYHGPGQIVAYMLVDLKRRGYGVRELVSRMERAVVVLLAGYGVTAKVRRDAPGVYVNEAKIAALGLRIKRGCSYHGLSLNVDMDLSPFLAINPCGYPGMTVTQTTSLGITDGVQAVAAKLVQGLLRELG